MTPDGWITLVALAILLICLALELFSVDFLMLVVLVVLVLLGVVDLDTALLGFANSTLLALGSLFVIAAGLREAGVLELAARHLLGSQRSVRSAVARLTATSTAASAFLNNTPIVAMGIPAVRNWARGHGISPSKLLIPLSYASILGGLCTLIGTSTNLVTHGLLQSHGMPGLGFFELSRIGIPCAVLGFFYFVFVAPNLLPEREEVQEAEARERGPLLELEVEEGSPVAGRTVRETGLEALPGHTLVRIERGERSYGPVEEEEELAPGDILAYERLEEEAKPDRAGPMPDYSGLHLAPHPEAREGQEARDRATERHEVVVKEGSAFVGRELRSLELGSRFGATVIGVRRGGKHVKMPLSEVELRPGDVLILETRRGFRRAFEQAKEFFVTSEAGAAGEEEQIVEREPEAPGLLGAVLVLVGVVGLTAVGITHIAVAGTLGAFTMVVLGYLTPGEAREAVDWSILVVIGAALGLGQAMEASGAAEWIGHQIVGALAEQGPLWLLVGVYLSAIVLTEVITNNGAAALLFPIALSVAQSQGLDPRPFMIGITVAASTSMLTPIGYQTNLMVYGAGNYRFTDFTRVGGPLQLAVGVVAITLIPRFWSF